MYIPRNFGDISLYTFKLFFVEYFNGYAVSAFQLFTMHFE